MLLHSQVKLVRMTHTFKNVDPSFIHGYELLRKCISSSQKKARLSPRHVCFSSGPGSFRTQRADTLVIWSLLCITAWAHFWEMPCSVAKYHCVIRQSVKIMPRILSMLCAVLGKLLGKCRELSYRLLCIKRCPMTLKLPHREM